MNPERWQQVDKLLELALEQEPSRRSVFLDEACQGDAALRQEVESLLSAHGNHRIWGSGGRSFRSVQPSESRCFEGFAQE